jgi:hypothetical protein
MTGADFVLLLSGITYCGHWELKNDNEWKSIISGTEYVEILQQLDSHIPHLSLKTLYKYLVMKQCEPGPMRNARAPAAFIINYTHVAFRTQAIARQRLRDLTG